MKHYSWLFGLILLSLLLRTVQLGSNPAGFFRDEADKGYTTFCLIETGQDQTGKPYPLFVRSLNVTTSSLYQYINIPFIYTMGLTEFAVRLPAALAGVLSMLSVYLLARKWWDPTTALWAGLFVCLSPWSLLLSRWANQSILLTVSIPLAILFFTWDQNSTHPSKRNTTISAIFFLIALYTYAPARLFIPVLVSLIWIISFVFMIQRKTDWKSFALSILIFGGIITLGTIPLAYHLLYETAESSARLTNITIFRGQPLSEILTEWLQNYTIHLSPSFLFIHGDDNLRHNTAVFGQLHWYILPLILFGLFRIFRSHTQRDCILLAWFLCFPISAACTWEGIPHALRSVFAVPIAQIIAAYGILEFHHLAQQYKQHITAKLRNAITVIWISSIILLSSIYCYDLFFRYPIYSAFGLNYGYRHGWEYGYKQAIEWWQTQRQPGEHTVVSGMAEYPEWFFLFYDQVPPAHWIEHHTIEGVTFIPRGYDCSPYFKESPEVKTYYLLRTTELPNYSPTKSILLPGKPGGLPEPIWKWVVIE